MAVLCNDFIFLRKRISDFKLNGFQKYIFVDFDESSNVELAMSREMEMGVTNRYRNEPNYFYTKWSSTLSLEFDIIKNPCAYSNQNEAEFTKTEIRELTSWLTSSHFPQWLQPDKSYNKLNLRYKGYFSNIESYAVSGTVYGLKLIFQCTTPFAYTEELVNESIVSSYKNVLINNNSDEIDDYCYPKIDIYPNSDGDIYICNLSDCTLLDNGILGGTTDFAELVKTVQNYAKLKGYTIKTGSSNSNSIDLVPICNNTSFQFYLVDKYGESTKCTAFFMPDTKEYRIIIGGFMYMKAYRDLPIHIDCQKLMIYDDLNRMITYDKLGINDVDSIYWLRLLNGNNSILLSGNCKFTIKHSESRKVGE